MHDGELALTSRAAAEPVCGVGQPILMQSTGDKQCRSDRRHRAKQRREAKRKREPIDERADAADDDTGDRQRPARAGEIGARVRCGCGSAERQSGCELQCDPQIAREAE